MQVLTKEICILIDGLILDSTVPLKNSTILLCNPFCKTYNMQHVLAKFLFRESFYVGIFFQWFEQNEMQIIFYREIAIYGVC